MIAAIQVMPKRKDNDGTGRAMERLANLFDVSVSTLFQLKAVMKAAKEAPKEDKVPGKILKDVKNGKVAPKTAYKALKRHQNPDSVKDVTFTVTNASGLPKNVEFLKSAVILLAEAANKDELSCGTIFADMLINHFLRKNQRRGFYDLLPDEIKAKLPRLPLLVSAEQ
jgi:hypothetical protein